MGAGNKEFGRYNPFSFLQCLNWLLQLAMIKMIQNRTKQSDSCYQRSGKNKVQNGLSWILENAQKQRNSEFLTCEDCFHTYCLHLQCRSKTVILRNTLMKE